MIPSIVGAIISGLVQFFSTRAGSIFLGLGLSVVAYTGINGVIQAILGDLQILQNTVNSGAGNTGSGVNLGYVMLQLAAYCGLPDSINIVLSGAITKVSIAEGRAFIKRMTG